MTKNFIFDIIQSEFKEIKSDCQTTFQLYEDYKNSLKNDIECTKHYLDVYTYFLEYVTKYQNDYNKIYKYAVVKYQLKMKSKEPSSSELEPFLNLFHYKNWIEEKGNDIFVGDDDTDNIASSNKMELDNTTKDFIKIDKRYKEDKINKKQKLGFW